MLGDAVADAQLEATAQAGFGDAKIAFMNLGGIRTNAWNANVGVKDSPNVCAKP